MNDNGRLKTITRTDVAKAANTSATTVSYVINNGPKAVAPATRQRVLAAIDELGYRPNLIARSLRAAHTETIGMLVPQVENPFFAGLVAAIEKKAIAQSKMVLFGTTSYRGQTEDHYLSSFDDRMVDAILVIGPSKELRSATSKRQGALLILDRTGHRNVVSIGINQQESAASPKTSPSSPSTAPTSGATWCPGSPPSSSRSNSSPRQPSTSSRSSHAEAATSRCPSNSCFVRRVVAPTRRTTGSRPRLDDLRWKADSLDDPDMTASTLVTSVGTTEAQE